MASDRVRVGIIGANLQRALVILDCVEKLLSVEIQIAELGEACDLVRILVHGVEQRRGGLLEHGFLLGRSQLLLRHTVR